MTTFTTLCTSTTSISFDRALAFGQVPIAGGVKRGRKGIAIRLMARTQGDEITSDSVIYAKKAGHQPYSTGYRICDVPDLDALLRLIEAQQDAADTGHFQPRAVPLDAIAAFWMDENKPSEKEPDSVKKRYRDSVSKWELLLTMWPNATQGDITQSECHDYANWRTGAATKVERPPCPRICGSMSTVHGDLVLLANAIAEYKAAHQLAWAPTVWIPKKDAGRLLWLRRRDVARIDWAIRGRIWDHDAGGWKTEVDPETGEIRNVLRPQSDRERRKMLYRFRKIGVELGMRHTALIQMRWWPHAEHGYFDLESEIVHRAGHSVDPTIGKRRMSSFMPKPLIWWLSKWKEKDLALGIDRVIHKQDGTGYRSNLSELWNDVIADAGLSKDIVPHVMRHTCCTWLKHLRVDVQTAADYVGMHPKTLLRVYGQWSIEGSRWAAEAFADRKLLRQLERNLPVDGRGDPAEAGRAPAAPNPQRVDQARRPMSEETRKRVSAGMTALWRRRKGLADDMVAAM